MVGFSLNSAGVCCAQSVRPDLMWSDPDEVDNWAVSPRGAGWLFGASVTQEVGTCPLTILRLLIGYA